VAGATADPSTGVGANSAPTSAQDDKQKVDDNSKVVTKPVVKPIAKVKAKAPAKKPVVKKAVAPANAAVSQ
jgi:hypothetical protein